MNDFDFIIGEWTVLNKRLVNRLVESNEWVEFEADYKSWHVLNGFGNMDEMRVGEGPEEFCGLSMRIYNPEKKEWTIYWADTENIANGINPQVKGSFNGKRGVFIGEELYKSKLMQLRFIWESRSEDEAYWEQAYFDESKKEWETNWTMTFKRKKGKSL